MERVGKMKNDVVKYKSTSFLKFTAKNRKNKMKAFSMLLLIFFTLNFSNSFSQVCSTPGIDGPITSTPPINTYYPPNGDITLSSGMASVSLGAVPLTDPFGNSYGIVEIKPGDLLLIIQIQGADFNTTGNNTYGRGLSNSGPDGLGGTGYTNLNNVGYYEYLVALNSVSLSGGVLQFRGAGSGSGLVNTYYNQEATSSQGQRRFQVVRVPQFSTLTLTNNLSCPAWNGKVGGIIALDAAGAINMNGFTIDASGAGFRAGYQNRENSDENLNTYRTTTSNRASGKGEGIAGTPRWMFDGQNQVDQGVTWIGYPQGDYGRGAPGNAGGGGNDHNAGGGGGGNGGAGGVGGNGWAGAGGASAPHGGRPGINTPLNLDRIFLGGGGGGGDANNALTGVKGGPGGGAIFITADLINGTGTFIANGDDGQVGVYGSAPDGAGGGGAGGSIFIKTHSASPSAILTIIANGGKGGNTVNDDGISHTAHGPGGGGGGGTVFYSIPGATVSTQTKSGKHGITNGGAGNAYGSVDGQAGSASSFLISSLPPYLQGFSASCMPELVVKKSRVSLNPVSGGSSASYKITIENVGGGAAGGTQLRDQLPSGFSFQSATVSYSGNATGPASLTNIGTSGQPIFESFNIPFNGKVTINMDVDIATSVASGTYHNGAQTHFLDPTRNSSDPIRLITPALNAIPGSKTTYQSSGSSVTGSNYNGTPSGPTTEDVIVNAFIDAIDDDYSGSPINGYSGGIAVVNVISNDLFRNVQATISNVKISVVTPASNPGVVLNSSTGAVSVSPLTPGGTYTIDYKICEVGNLTNCDQARITVVVIPTANLSITKTDNADPVIAGQNITYTITISNSGPSNAINVAASDVLPSELTLISATRTKGNFTYPDWTIDSIKVNESVTLTIVAKVNSNVLSGSNIHNTATVSSTTLDPVLSNNTAAQITSVITRADLSVTKTATPNPVIAGTDLTYTITISNVGPSDAQNVSVADMLPAEFSNISASTTAGSWSYPNWNVGTLVANTSQTLTITASVDANVLQSSVISNTVTLTSSTPDPVSANNTDTYVVDVNAFADLSITKVSSNSQAIAGQTETYTITVSNAGPSVAQSVVVTDIVPAMIINPEYSDNGGATWNTWSDLNNLGTLSLGAEIKFLIRGTINATIPSGTQLSNIASVASSTSDPNSTNNSDTETINIGTLSDLSIEKTGPATIIAGTKITYGLTVINHGPSNAASVVIADAVPADITNAEYSLNNGNSWGVWNGTRNLPDFEAIPGINNILIRGNLSPGADGTIINTATVSSATPDTNLTNNSSEVTTLVTGEADLILSKTTLTSPVNKNQPIEYLISVFNNGPSNAPNVVITDSISLAVISGQQYSTNNGTTWNVWSGSLNIGTLVHDDTYKLMIKGTVTNDATDPISNTASVTSSVTDPFPDNNTSTIVTPLAVEADLSVVKTGPATITAGTSVEYSIVVTNKSPNMNALEVMIVDNIDLDLIPNPEFSINGGSSWSPWTGSLNIGTLNFGANYTLLIRGNVLSNVKVNITNTAHVSSNTPDPVLTNNSSSITSTLTRSADISLVKELVTEPQNLIAGKPVEYLITYRNDGPSDATNFLITDLVPSMITDVEASRCASAFNAWPGTFNAQTVVAGGTCTIRIRGIVNSNFKGSITNTASVASDLTDPNLTNNSSSITNAVNTQADLYIAKTAVPEPAVAGENMTYTISVTNLGSSDALAVKVTDNLPSELTFVSAAPGVGTWTSPNWSIGTLVNGSTATLTIVAKVKTDILQGDIISNTATVTSSTPDPFADNNTAIQTTSVNASADLMITKTDNADPIIAGDNIEYTITLTNNGSSDAVNVSVTDVLPVELSFVSATPSSGTWVAPNWNIGTLNAGATRSMVIVAKVNTNVAQGSIISNTASVSSTTSDPVTDNNSATQETEVNSIADLEITKTASSATVVAGENITYTINIRNNGQSDAVNVVVNDNLPPELTFVSAETNVGLWSSSQWDVGALAANASASITIIAQVNANVTEGTSISNTATISSSTTDLITENNSSTHNSSVTTSANLSILKTDNVDPVIAGENITYTISVTNEGPSDALDVNVLDELPSSLIFVSALPASGSWTTPEWNIGTLEAGATTSIEIVATVISTILQGDNISNTASVNSSTSDPVSANNSSTETTAVNTQADLAVTKTATPNPVIAGEDVTYTITITNNGPSDAQNVSVSDFLPSELYFGSASASLGSWSSPKWNIGTLAANTSETLTILATVDATVLQSSVISNTVTLSSATIDPVFENNTFTHDADVNALADLSITKEALSDPAFSGDLMTYLITVLNEGPSTAQSVQVSDVVPAILLNTEFSTDDGATWDTWIDFMSHGSLVVGDNFNFLLRGKVNTTTPIGTVLSNTAQVSSSTSDPNTANNSDTETVTVSTLSDLSIEKTGPATIMAGTKITYGLTVINHGPSNAANVVIADAVPAGITNAEYSLNNGNSWGIWNGTRNLPDFEAIPGINNILIRGNLATGASGTIINTATVSSSTDDSDLSNNSSTVNTIVTNQADLIISKSTLTSPVNKNQPIVYLISVFNNGPSDALNVVIKDAIDTTIISTKQFSIDNGITWNTWIDSINIGTLVHDATFNLRIKGTVTNNATNPISNTASVSSEAVDTIPGNNTQTIETPLAVEADLSIVKTGPATFMAGTAIQYSIVATNNSPNMNALDVVITDVVNVDLISNPEFSTNGGTTWGSWTGSLHIGTLNFGANYTLLIRGNVLSNVKVNIPNTAQVSSNTPDPVLSNNSSSITSTLTRSADISLVKVLVTEPNKLVAGEPIEYLITYRNDGPSDATNFLITDIVPTMITDVEASRCASAYITWPGTFNAQTVVAGGTCTIRIRGMLRSDFSGSITNTATVVSDLTDPNLENNTSTIINTVNKQADLFITKTAVPEPVVAGENITYTITVANLGSSDALEVRVTDILPSELHFVSASPGVGTWTSPVWNIGTLINGSVASMTLIASVDANIPQGRIISNTATVTSDTPDSVTVNNTSTQTTSVNASADLSITKTDNVDKVIAGNNITYTITVKNNGASDAVNVSVNDILPSELTYVSAAPTSGTWTTPKWTIGTLNAGATRSMVIVAKVNTNVLQGTIISNTATISSTTADPVIENNSATQTTEVNSNSDLAISKTASSTTVAAGENVTYTINITNSGPSDAFNVVVSDTLEPVLQFVSASSNGTHLNQTVSWVVSTLPSGSSRSFSLVAKVNSNAVDGSTITNIAFVKSEIGDTIESDPSVITVISNSILTITKDAESNFVNAGEDITYTINVKNSGQTIAQNSVVTDVLPLHTTFVSASNNGLYSNGKVTWLLGDIAVGVTKGVTLIVNANSNTPDGTIIRNAATVKSDNLTEPVNSDTMLVTVGASTLLTITKTAQSHSVFAGNNITYTISVRNDGSDKATNVEIFDELSSLVTFVSASNYGVLIGNKVKWDFFTLQKGQTVTVTLVVKARADLIDGTKILNSAFVKSEENQTLVESNEEWVIVESFSNISVTKIADKEIIAAGKNLKYTVTVSNSGPSDAKDIMIRDTLPGNLIFVSASHNGIFSNGVVLWNLPSIRVNETVNYELIVTVKPDVANGTKIFNSVVVTGDSTFIPKESDPEITTVISVADLGITKVAYPKPAVAGGPIYYTITVTNYGPSDASNVVVDDLLPPELIFVLENHSFGTWVAPKWNIGTLNAGSKSILTIAARVKSVLNSSSLIINTATVTSTTSDTILNNNTSTDVTSVNELADLSIIKSAANEVVAGNQIYYSIAVTNNGPSMAHHIVINDVVPPQVSNPTYSTDGGINWKSWNGTFIIDSLIDGSTSTIMLKGYVGLNIIGAITNTVDVKSNTPDPNVVNNTDTETTVVRSVADLGIHKTGPAFVEAGGNILYTFHISPGAINATNVVVTDVMPSEISEAKYSLDGGITWNNWPSNNKLLIGTVEANKPYSFLVKGKVNQSAKDSIVNIVTISGTIPDTDPTNNTSREVTPIISKTNLSIVKGTNLSTVKAGENVSYTITVSNGGLIDATHVIVRDTLPVGLTFISASEGGILSNGIVTWNIESLPFGSIKVLGLVVKVNSNVLTGTSIRNVAFVRDDITDDPVKSDPVNINVGTSSVLEIVKTANNKEVKAGNIASYNINIHNSGPSDAVNVMVTDTLPVGLTFVSASNGGIVENGVVKWLVQSLPNGTNLMFKLDVRVKSNVVEGTIIWNSASIIKGNTNGSVVSKPEDIQIKAESNLEILKSAVDSVFAGENLTYTIQVKNNGPSDAPNVIVSDPLPQGVSFVSATSGGTLLNGIVNWNISSLSAGANFTCSVVVKVADNLVKGTIISNIATITSNNTKVPVASNKVTTIVTTKKVPPLEIKIIANNDSGKPVVGTIGGVVVPNILVNDSVGNKVANVSLVNITLVSSLIPNIKVDLATGEVSVTPDIKAGTYEIVYRICLKDNPGVCDEATITITVLAPKLIANDDNGTPVNNVDGGIAIEDVIENDRLDGNPVDLTEVIITIVNSPPLAGIYLNTSNGQVIVTPAIPAGKYEITYRICEILNPNNCDEAVVTIIVSEKEKEICDLFIPNGFSPNGDGIHDLFMIKCIENYPNAAIEIFNRWGNLVFKKNNYGNNVVWGTTEAWWDGRSIHNWNIGGEKLPPGTYFYILKLNSGDEKPKAGSIFLNW